MERKDVKKYCEHCRKEVEYKVGIEEVKYTIANSSVTIKCEVPRCIECGEELNDNDLFEKNAKLAKEEYMNKYNILTVDEIKNILNKYDIGATVLSKILEWGDITITRYIKGKLPSKNYSDKLREINKNPQILMDALEKHKDEISELAYSKCKTAILKSLDESCADISIGDKINTIVKYILSKVEITPLALQKTLYFIQGFSIAFNNKFIFNNVPEAWIHGPVYPSVYNQYKQFYYNDTITYDDNKFNENLENKDKQLIDAVLKYLTLYNGTILERITHIESPWINARNGYEDNERCNNPIKLEDIEEYFKNVKDKYKMLTYLDISSYAQDMSQKVM